MKKWLCFVLCLVLLTGCAPQRTQFSVNRLDLFDTVINLTAFCNSRDDFDAQAQKINEQLQRYHCLFDIYEEYEGIHNLKTVNDAAGKHPIAVDEVIIALLKDCVRYYELTDGRVNVAMGSVLALWHEAREKKQLPSRDALQEAAKHTDITKLIIDEKNGTVFLSDPAMRLDVGAIAKGWAAQKCAEAAPEGYLLSVGGNVCSTGPKKEDATPWIVGIQDPNGGDGFLHTLALSYGSAVTSGDYQRFVELDGKRYHHIIDPDTLMPSELWRSVTVVCDDSALADALSTALFILPLEQGKALLEKTGAEAMWLDADGARYYSDGFEKFVQ